jgi:hypothetical protein
MRGRGAATPEARRRTMEDRNRLSNYACKDSESGVGQKGLTRRRATLA